MSETSYRIVRSTKANADSWVIEREGKAEGDYATKDAAFEAAAGAASNAIKSGFGVQISVPERAPGETAIGGRS